ncbi:hypothetical protein AAY473_002205, partial [Plecturocebus cupreus]
MSGSSYSAHRHMLLSILSRGTSKTTRHPLRRNTKPQHFCNPIPTKLKELLNGICTPGGLQSIGAHRNQASGHSRRCIWSLPLGMRDGPRQGIPPYLGSGLLQTRFRFRMPLLQSRLHCDHDVQADQAPLTVWAEYLPARRKSPESPAKGTDASMKFRAYYLTECVSLGAERSSSSSQGARQIRIGQAGFARVSESLLIVAAIVRDVD